jgi:methionyl aminopeptidase
MMIPVKTLEEIECIRKSARLLVQAFQAVRESIRPGVTTGLLDEVAEEVIRSGGGNPAFKGYRGYPYTICASLDSEVVHGMPGDRRLVEGQLVSVDIGVELGGWYSDAAVTYTAGPVDSEKQKLMDATKTALYRGIKRCRQGNRLSDISHAIQTYVEGRGFSVVRALVGHGIGRLLHEEPQIPNYGPPHKGPKLTAGMVFAIEPMVNMGTSNVVFLDDGWTVKTGDGSPSAHFEHTVLITENRPEILTAEIENTSPGREYGQRTTDQS